MSQRSMPRGQEPAAAGDAPLLSMSGIHVEFAQREGSTHAVRGVDLAVRPRETVALVGESGSGKSTLALAALGLLRPPGYLTQGDIAWRGQSIVGRDGKKLLESLRGTAMSMVWQDPSATFNPRMTVGTQLTEGMRKRLKMSRRASHDRACELLEFVGVREPKQRMGSYPHEFSGGMLQRVGMAAAVACEPELLIADEPTTALDVTVQAQVLELLGKLQREFGMAVVFITHDLATVSVFCERVVVLYAGRVTEEGPVSDVFTAPQHPYTARLLDSMPTLEGERVPLRSIPGSPPDLSHQVVGCGFENRCARSLDRCRHDDPVIEPSSTRRAVACWNPQEAPRAV